MDFETALKLKKSIGDTVEIKGKTFKLFVCPIDKEKIDHFIGHGIGLGFSDELAKKLVSGNDFTVGAFHSFDGIQYVYSKLNL